MITSRRAAAVLMALVLLATTVLFELRLLGRIDVSWWVVAAPLWLPVALCWTVVQVGLVLYAFAEIRNWLDKFDG